ncbi:fucose-1-phosphate guanylyltransferase [Nematostella vectensis]|uniref:fucose-1-phosphate guanylyltransferase n=1 Tax=Nematostella vectensis TaxID=45351 RepID=UPI00139047DF|nr:fucose-1-phosphate guanylyltransferase [Nematostella vectensis]XP_048586307.1 fucose-1-phosphate guanylyltransferase [Nematostella vectensis]
MASAKKFKHIFSDKSQNIRDSTIKRLKQFDNIRGKHVDIPFWDIIVITASDAAQKKAFEIQLEAKLKRKELPLGPIYHVFSDPPGPKVGNGGSTMICIDELLRIHGEEKLSECKIMLAHAGGYSQRMPNASVLGKVFTALPWGDPPYQMLEMLMAMFIDFPVNMIPGVLLVCPDTLELFNTGIQTCCFTKPGFTALAHPSPIEIGTTHGVFVFKDKHNENVMCQTTCSKFLHKQSTQVMRQHGLVFQQDDQDHVYTDSIFFIDMTAAKKLQQLYSKITLDCEICAYGDFLQALGPEATEEYTENVANVSKVESSLVKTRKMIFDYLKGTALNVLVLNESRFYHLGTTAEFIHHLCVDPIFRYETSASAEVFVSRSGNPTHPTPESSILMHCHVTEPLTIGTQTVVEYCNIESGSSIGGNCIVSNVCLPDGVSIMDRTFLMTVCVELGSRAGLFVTVGYGVDDNMKKQVKSANDLDSLKYFGKPLGQVFSHLGIDQSDWDMVTLWHARLFPVFTDQRSSVLHTLEMIQSLREGKEFSPPVAVLEHRHTDIRLSMADILVNKDVQGTLDLREILREKIIASI